MIFILGGNRQQAVDYARYRGLGPSDYKVINRPDDMHGLPRPTVIVCIGTYKQRADLMEMTKLALARKTFFIHDITW